jgi:hypothetical protein
LSNVAADCGESVIVVSFETRVTHGDRISRVKNEREAEYSFVMSHFERTRAFVFLVLLIAALSACRTHPRPVANGDSFLRCVGPEASTDYVCDGLVVRVVGNGTLVTEKVIPPIVRRHVKGTRFPREKPAESMK